MSTPTLTITTAQYRAWCPWENAGTYGAVTLYRSVHTGEPFTRYIDADENTYHGDIVREQDAAIEAYKRQVLGEEEESE